MFAESASGYRPTMATLLIVLLLLALLGVLGAVVEGVLWLALIAAVLVAAGSVFGWFKFRSWRTG